MMKNQARQKHAKASVASTLKLMMMVAASVLGGGWIVDTANAFETEVAGTCMEASAETCEVQPSEDRIWLISTRSITSQACLADLQTPQLSVSRLSTCGHRTEASLTDYLEMIQTSPEVVVYVHGNRMGSCDAINRGLKVRAKINCYRNPKQVDWVFWSWPSAKQGILASDARLKASRCDAQGLYLGWLLRHHSQYQTPTALIGYSFGGRVLTGALHAVAGGRLAGRQLDGEPAVGMNTRIGLIAPAIESHWLTCRGYHQLATQNIDEITLLYNHRDAVLKRYWLLSQVRGEAALGYTGPTAFAPRVDGTKMPVYARDCAPVVGLQHIEMDYYNPPCHAGRVLARLLDDVYQSR